MANEIKNYFLAPSWDYPRNGPITLGNIVRTPDKIVPPLYAHKPTDSDPPINLSSKTGVDWSRAKAAEGSFGVWAKFLQFLGVGLDIGVDFKNADDRIYHFERIDTEEFFPDEEAIRKRMATPAVKSYLEKSRFRKEVYMIVGIKRVTGANVKSTVERERGGELDIALDGTVLTGAPVSVGPKVKYKTRKKDEMSFEGSTDFVFAFRLRKVRVNKKDEVGQDDYRKGTLLEDQVDEVPVSETFTMLGLEDRDASAEDFGLEEHEYVMDGEEKVRVAASESSD
jgi:hypothetical protein